ncbi:MAG: hypothetical protein ACR2GY_00710 [Phycisphaerales bacterium]
MDVSINPSIAADVSLRSAPTLKGARPPVEDGPAIHWSIVTAQKMDEERAAARKQQALSNQQLREIVSGARAGWQPEALHDFSKQAAMEVMNILDKDKDGALTGGEIPAALQGNAAIDTQGDRIISTEELAAYFMKNIDGKSASVSPQQFAADWVAALEAGGRTQSPAEESSINLIAGRTQSPVEEHSINPIAGRTHSPVEENSIEVISGARTQVDARDVSFVAPPDPTSARDTYIPPANENVSAINFVPLPEITTSPLASAAATAQGHTAVHRGELETMAQRITTALEEAGFTHTPPINIRDIVDSLGLKGMASSLMMQMLSHKYPDGLGVNLTA